ncbi:MAG: hypothetical protein V1910_01320 [bacterium]
MQINNYKFELRKLFGKIINPKRDWRILIILFIIFVAISVIFDFYMYQQIKSGDMYVNVNKTELIIENLKSNDLQTILDNFENKKIKTETFKMENKSDPSL